MMTPELEVEPRPHHADPGSEIQLVKVDIFDPYRTTVVLRSNMFYLGRLF